MHNVITFKYKKQYHIIFQCFWVIDKKLKRNFIKRLYCFLDTRWIEKVGFSFRSCKRTFESLEIVMNSKTLMLRTTYLDVNMFITEEAAEGR